MNNSLLSNENAILLIIDIQEKLIRAQFNKENVEKNSKKLLNAANLLNIPTIVTEQYPEGLGHTIPELKQDLSEKAVIFEKKQFSCLTPQFKSSLESSERKQVIICGIETHICVHQTVNDLIDSGYEVHLVTDAISSRKPEENEIGIKRMLLAGAIPTCTEMVLFELIKCATHEKFREIQKLIK